MSTPPVIAKYVPKLIINNIETREIPSGVTTYQVKVIKINVHVILRTEG